MGPYRFSEELPILLNIVDDQLCWCPNEKEIGGRVRCELSHCQSRDSLVDVEDLEALLGRHNTGSKRRDGGKLANHHLQRKRKYLAAERRIIRRTYKVFTRPPQMATLLANVTEFRNSGKVIHNQSTSQGSFNEPINQINKFPSK